MPDSQLIDTASNAVEPKSSYLATFRSIATLLKLCAQTLGDARRGTLDHDVLNARMKEIGDTVIREARARVTVEGLEHLDPKQAYLFMSNHESLMDIPLLFSTAPQPPRMVTKAELFKVPIWGPALKVAGFISIDRKNRTQAIKNLGQGKDLMDQGHHVWIAPEGTRSRDGSLLPFKKGGFMLALETGATIVPVGIVGARNVIRPETFQAFLDQDVTVRYGTPIDASAYGLERREELMADVRSAIEALRRP